MKLPTRYASIPYNERWKVREEYARRQGGKCMYCKEALDAPPPARITDHEIDWEIFPVGFLNHPVHLQHDHYTGMTEGAVHAYCNAVMWQYEGR